LLKLLYDRYRIVKEHGAAESEEEKQDLFKQLVDNRKAIGDRWGHIPFTEPFLRIFGIRLNPLA